SFQIQGPGAKQSHHRSDQGPTEGLIPGQKSNRPFDVTANPERIEIGLMVTGDDHAARIRNMFEVAPTNPPQQPAEDTHSRAKNIHRPLREHSWIRTRWTAPLWLFNAGGQAQEV